MIDTVFICEGQGKMETTNKRIGNELKLSPTDSPTSPTVKIEVFIYLE